MSVRHFTRVFTAEVGESPSRFVERTRVEAARRELETTSDTLDVVAARCGLGSAETLRRVVQRHLGVAPDAYRRRFRAASDRKGLRMTDSDRLQIAIPIFPRCTALDAVGPYEVLQRIPTFDITFVGHARGEVRTENAMLGLQADATFEEVPDPDVIVFPGGVGTRPLEHDERVLDWVRHAHEGTRFTTSVCTGLTRARRRRPPRRPQRHHPLVVRPRAAAHGAEPTAQRVVEHLDRRLITAAGVSSGIDMALRLTELLVDRTAGQAAQLMIEYDPQPPFDCGAVDRSDDIVMTRVIEYAVALVTARANRSAARLGLRTQEVADAGVAALAPAKRPNIVESPIDSPLA